MAEHTPTPWRVFKTTDGRKLVGIGGQDGQGILDCGFGVWAWDDAEGIANAEMVVKAVNNHEALVAALEDAIDTLESMDLHADNPLYDRLVRTLTDVGTVGASND